MKRVSIILASLLLLASCTVTEKLSVNRNSSGTSSSDIKVEQFFVDVLEDFSEFLPESNESIMDSAMSGFAGQLQRSKSASDVAFSKTGENHYSLAFSYSSIEALIKELGGTEQTLFRETSNSLSFYVDINNFEELTKIVPFLADPNFEVYGPLFNQNTTEEDYLDMIYFLLGEEGPDAISNGMVSIDITVPGTIASVSGARRVNQNTARFSFPIIDFLLLNKPLTFTVNWK